MHKAVEAKIAIPGRQTTFPMMIKGTTTYLLFLVYSEFTYFLIAKNLLAAFIAFPTATAVRILEIMQVPKAAQNIHDSYIW